MLKVITFVPVVPAKQHDITRGSWLVGIAIWLGMLFIGFSSAFFERSTGAVAIVLIPVLAAQTATIAYSTDNS